jgi:hypothetical protein
VDIKRIDQSITRDSLFQQLHRWLQAGAGDRKRQIRVLSAFASGAAVESLEPLFDVFLADGNSLEIIVGIDRGGTDREAIKRLLALQSTYPTQVKAYVFQAPSRKAIFHPKLYLYGHGKLLSAVIGSSNLTLGGLAHNLESLVCIEGIPARSPQAREITGIWANFADPHSPLRSDFLQQLTPANAKRVCRQLPARSQWERGGRKQELQDLWRPLSTVPLRRSPEPIRVQRKFLAKQTRAYLLIDVLNETRSTQMQMPIPVVERFLGFCRDQEGSIHLSTLRGGKVSHPINRILVKSSGKAGTRLMRRIEMPQIRDLKRPLMALFFRLKGSRKFAFILIPRESRGFAKTNQLLDTYGQQGGAQRRFYIGGWKDDLWKDISALAK